MSRSSPTTQGRQDPSSQYRARPRTASRRLRKGAVRSLDRCVGEACCGFASPPERPHFHHAAASWPYRRPRSARSGHDRRK